MKQLVLLSALLALPLTLLAAPKYPFPNNVTYKYGIMPKGIDATKVQKAYEDFMKLYEESGDLGRIKHDTPANTVSEGIGYGMMILVYMDNTTNNTQAKFDKLWNYYKKFSGSVGGMMSWRIKGFSGPADPMMDKNSATDADLDVALGLLQAYKQWGDEKYLTDAKSLLDKIGKSDVNTTGYLKPGDSWDTEKNVSYFSTGALEVYKLASSFDWGKVLTNSYSLIKKVQNGTTGLVPNWCSEQGAASAGNRGDYTYDATRTPWRIAWAYSWYGHQDAKDICTKIASWIATKAKDDPANIVDGYKLDGTETSEYNNATFVGPFVCAGMVDAKHQAWLDKGYAHLSQLDETVYYQVSLKILTMLYLSGNMPNLWDYPASAVQNVKNAVSNQAITLSQLKGSQLSFSTSTAGAVTVSLFNASGKCVAAPVSGNFTAGNNTMHFSTPIAKGMYVVKMQSGQSVHTQRVMVTK